MSNEKVPSTAGLVQNDVRKNFLKLPAPTTVRGHAGPGAVVRILTGGPSVLAGLQDGSGGGLLAHTTAG